jgi:hypothetical protein
MSENSQSRGSGSVITASTTAEELSRVLAEITRFRFSVEEATPGSKPSTDDSKWYLLADEDVSKVYHSRMYWITQDGTLHILSMYLGNLTEFIEDEYHQSAADVPNPGGSDLAAVREYFAKTLPLVEERLGAYQNIIEDVAYHRHVEMDLMCEGDELTATFFMKSDVDLNGKDEKQQSILIQGSLNGMKEALDEIRQYDLERLNDRQPNREIHPV